MKCILQSIGQLTNSDLLDHLRKVEEDAKKRIDTKLRAPEPHMSRSGQVTLDDDSLFRPVPDPTRSSGDQFRLSSISGISNPRHTDDTKGIHDESSHLVSNGFESDTARAASNLNYINSANDSQISAAPHPPSDAFPRDGFPNFALHSSIASHVNPVNSHQHPASGFSDRLRREVTSILDGANSFQWNSTQMNATNPSSRGSTTSVRGGCVERPSQMGNMRESSRGEIAPAIWQPAAAQRLTLQRQDENGMYANIAHQYGNPLPDGHQPVQHNRGRCYEIPQALETQLPEPRAFANTDPFESMGSSSANFGYHSSSTGAPRFPPQVSQGQDLSRDSWGAHQPHPFHAPHFSTGPSFVSSGRVEAPMTMNEAFHAGYASSEFAGRNSGELWSHGSPRHRAGEAGHHSPFASQRSAEPSDFAFDPAPRRPDPEVLEGIGLTSAQIQLLLQHGYGSSLGGYQS